MTTEAPLLETFHVALGPLRCEQEFYVKAASAEDAADRVRLIIDGPSHYRRAMQHDDGQWEIFYGSRGVERATGETFRLRHVRRKAKGGGQ